MLKFSATLISIASEDNEISNTNIENILQFTNTLVVAFAEMLVARVNILPAGIVEAILKHD